MPRGVSEIPFAWSLFNLTGTALGAGLLLALTALVFLLFTLGVRTRAMTALAWLALSSLHNRNPYVTDGGDDLVRIFLFLSMFTDLGRAYSLDVRLGWKTRAPAPAPLACAGMGV